MDGKNNVRNDLTKEEKGMNIYWIMPEPFKSGYVTNDFSLNPPSVKTSFDLNEIKDFLSFVEAINFCKRLEIDMDKAFIWKVDLQVAWQKRGSNDQ